jgi:hypothetical protein
MGREAICTCTLDGKQFEVKALLEPPELILRGAIRRRIPFSEMKAVKAEAAQLSFRTGSNRLCLQLGESAAAKWAQAILSPPPTLAKKLGIENCAVVRVMGTVDDVSLQEVLARSQVGGRGKVDVVLACVNTPAELKEALNKTAEDVESGAALWMIYRKGPKHAINESDVRAAGLATGIVDVKVASVSSALTALKFVKRKNPKPFNA